MPIGFLAAIPLLQHQVYVITEETQLLGCFMVFVGTIYSQFGDAIRKNFDSQSAAIMTEHNTQEDTAIAAVKHAIGAHEMRLSMAEDWKQIFDYQRELLDALGVAKQNELKYICRSDILKEMDFMCQYNDDLKQRMKVKFIDMATKAVKDEFVADKDLQAKALNEALDLIADPSKKAADDVIGKLFSSSIAKITDKVKSNKAPLKPTPEQHAILIEEMKLIDKRLGIVNGDYSSKSLPVEAYWNEPAGYKSETFEDFKKWAKEDWYTPRK
jgi:cbb3-type cytochrome oxidase subunit 3